MLPLGKLPIKNLLNCNSKTNSTHLIIAIVELSSSSCPYECSLTDMHRKFAWDAIVSNGASFAFIG
jgi:hypothetical protein